MTAPFEDELEEGLEALAAGASLPAADLHNQVRSRIAKSRRRRRTALLTAGAAACAAAVLSLALTSSGGTARQTSPASNGVPAATATAGAGVRKLDAPCDVTASFPNGLAKTGLGASPPPTADPTFARSSGQGTAKETIIDKLWTHCTERRFSDVRVVWIGGIGSQTAVLAAGRQADGRTGMVLLVEYPATQHSPRLSLLLDLPMLSQPSAPLVFGLPSGTGDQASGTYVALTTPCTGQQPEIITGPREAAVQLHRDTSGALIMNVAKPHVLTSVTVRCEVASGGAMSFPLNHEIVSPLSAKHAGITLFTNQ